MSNSNSAERRQEYSTDQCGLAQASELLGDRWLLLILRELFYGVGRFEDIRKDIPVPKSVLSAKLGGLVAAGLVEKRPYKPEGGRTRNAYHLTPMGRDLAMSFLALLDWGNRHLPIAGDPVHPVHRETGRGLKLALIDPETGDEVALRDVWISDRPR